MPPESRPGAGTTVLTPQALLRWLKLHRHLRPLLREVLAETLSVQAARQAGLVVSAEELQQAADAFRRRHGLTSAADTNAWLAHEGLTGADFEESLERDFLVAKLKDHLTRDRIASHFADHQADYARVRLRQILVDREELARELLNQLQEEDADFAQLAATHSRQATAQADGGNLGWVVRSQLSAALAEAVFAAREGEVVGPVATPEGFYLCRVEALQQAQLDEDTARTIREELFNAWLQQQLQTAPVEFPLLSEV